MMRSADSRNKTLLAVVAVSCLFLWFFMGGSERRQASAPLASAWRANPGESTSVKLRDAYLMVMRDVISGIIYPSYELSVKSSEGTAETLAKRPLDMAQRDEGDDWPWMGVSMVGIKRLNNIRYMLETVAAEKVAGDFVECGVWRGGASMYAVAVLESMGESQRLVHMVDSFKGLPPPRTEHDVDTWTRQQYLRVPLTQIKQTYATLHLPTDRVRFHEGYFVDSLPSFPRDRSIAVLRADGDMYESTMDILFNLYELLSTGGFVVIDDWTIDEAKNAVNDFRKWFGIDDEIVRIDRNSVYWRKGPKRIVVDQAKYRECCFKKK